MAATDINFKLECPVCLDYFQIPIRQCLTGHSFCAKCIRENQSCPLCRKAISEARNFALESLIDHTLLPCENVNFGCNYKLDKEKMILHRSECQYRKIKCEGKVFCKWLCNFEDRNILEHFKKHHKDNSNLQFNSTVSIVYNNAKDFNDIQLISAHYQLFWYKYRVDISKQKAFWAFQMIGPKNKAQKYYYEFEFFDTSIRKYKVTEFCMNDVEDIDKIFDEEKCVAISLKYLKSFLNSKNEFTFRYRIMKIQNEKIDGKNFGKKLVISKK